MILLFDQNISFKVPAKIQDCFPEAKHLSDLKIESFKDIEIWQFAKVHNYCIVTFDYDFIDLSTLKGFPPKIILLKTGNTTTENLIFKLKQCQNQIEDFLASKDTAFLEIK